MRPTEKSRRVAALAAHKTDASVLSVLPTRSFGDGLADDVGRNMMPRSRAARRLARIAKVQHCRVRVNILEASGSSGGGSFDSSFNENFEAVGGCKTARERPLYRAFGEQTFGYRARTHLGALRRRTLAGAQELTPPLFILAPPRSFTSVTCAMLGCHPQMYGLPEINLFAGETMADMQEIYLVRAHREQGLLRSLAQLAFSEQSEETVEAARQWLLANSELSTVELFRTMQSWMPDRVLIDKSPLHASMPEAMRRMLKHFPEARYLHLTRHPGDTMKSLLQLQQALRDWVVERKGWGHSLPAPRHSPDRLEKFWLQPHLAIIQFLKSVPAEQQMRLRGEDLLSEPRTNVRQIAEWLGVRTDDEATEAMLHPENSPYARIGPTNAKFGNDPNFLENPALRPYTYTPRPLTWEPEPGRPVEVSETVRLYAMQFGY